MVFSDAQIAKRLDQVDRPYREFQEPTLGHSFLADEKCRAVETGQRVWYRGVVRTFFYQTVQLGIEVENICQFQTQGERFYRPLVELFIHHSDIHIIDNVLGGSGLSEQAVLPAQKHLRHHQDIGQDRLVLLAHEIPLLLLPAAQMMDRLEHFLAQIIFLQARHVFLDRLPVCLLPILGLGADNPVAFHDRAPVMEQAGCHVPDKQLRAIVKMLLVLLRTGYRRDKDTGIQRMVGE